MFILDYKDGGIIFILCLEYSKCFIDIFKVDLLNSYIRSDMIKVLFIKDYIDI